MKKRKEQAKSQYEEDRLIKRMRIYLIVTLVLFFAIIVEVLEGTFGRRGRAKNEAGLSCSQSAFG
jgi:hypothetical protein